MAREGAHTAGGRWDGRVWLWWVASSAVGSAIVGGGIRFNTSIEGLIVLLCLGGAVIGIGQWALVLRGRVQGLGVGWWIAGSVISGCTPLVLLGTESVPSLLSIGASLMAGLLGTLAGGVQWLALTRRVWWAPLWIGISAAGSAVGWPAGAYVGNVVAGLSYGPTAGYVGSAMLTGLAMARLAR